MKKARGDGLVYQPSYRDKRTGDSRKATTWWIQYSVEGRRFRESSNSRVRRKAEALLRKRLEAAARGEKFGPWPGKPTFEQLLEILLNHYRINGRRSVGRVEDAAIHLRQFFGDVKLDQIDRDLVERYVRSRRNEEAASATINRELAALRRAFKLAQFAGKVTYRPEISTLPEENRRRGFFQDYEYQAVLENLPEHLRPVIQTAYVTGWRINSEILVLQKHHVDLDSGYLGTAPSERTGRKFPLTPELRKVLAQQLEKTREFEQISGTEVPWLFHRNGRQLKDFRKAWATACQKARVPPRLPDDLRRTAVRNLEYAGVSRSTAMAIVGHRSDSIYRSISTVDGTTIRESASKIAAFQQARISAGIPKNDVNK